MASPKSGPWWVLCVRVARGSSQHQRCSNYALTTLCGLCAGPCEWISLSILPSPIPELQHAPLPLKVLGARERVPTPPSSAVFHLDSHLSPSRSWECVNQGVGKPSHKSGSPIGVLTKSMYCWITQRLNSLINLLQV